MRVPGHLVHPRVHGQVGLRGTEELGQTPLAHVAQHVDHEQAVLARDVARSELGLAPGLPVDVGNAEPIPLNGQAGNGLFRTLDRRGGPERLGLEELLQVGAGDSRGERKPRVHAALVHVVMGAVLGGLEHRGVLGRRGGALPGRKDVEEQPRVLAQAGRSCVRYCDPSCHRQQETAHHPDRKEPSHAGTARFSPSGAWAKPGPRGRPGWPFARPHVAPAARRGASSP